MYIKILSFLSIILFSLYSTGCNAKSDSNNDTFDKQENKPQTNGVNLKKTTEENRNNIYSLVETQKKLVGSDSNNSEVLISYQDILFSIKIKNDNPLLSYISSNKKLASNIPVEFNYIYGDDLDTSTKNIKLFINKSSEGLLVLPTTYEERPSFILIPFNKYKLGKSSNLEVVSNDCENFDTIILDNKTVYKIKKDNKLCYSKFLKNSVNADSNSTVKTAKAIPLTSVKIYFDNVDEGHKGYVTRPVPANKTPNELISTTIQQYLDGVKEKDAEKGFMPNNLGINKFKVKILNASAYINFYSDDLQIDTPQKVINFTSNITKTAEQFPTIKNVEICINGISNYQTAFFANEPEVKCEF